MCTAQSPKKLEALITRACSPPSLAFCFLAGSVLAFGPWPASQPKGFLPRLSLASGLVQFPAVRAAKGEEGEVWGKAGWKERLFPEKTQAWSSGLQWGRSEPSLWNICSARWGQEDEATSGAHSTDGPGSVGRGAIPGGLRAAALTCVYWAH